MIENYLVYIFEKILDVSSCVSSS